MRTGNQVLFLAGVFSWFENSFIGIDSSVSVSSMFTHLNLNLFQLNWILSHIRVANNIFSQFEYPKFYSLQKFENSFGRRCTIILYAITYNPQSPHTKKKLNPPLIKTLERVIPFYPPNITIPCDHAQPWDPWIITISKWYIFAIEKVGKDSWRVLKFGREYISERNIPSSTKIFWTA